MTKKSFTRRSLNAAFLSGGLAALLLLGGCSENRQFGHPSLEPAPKKVQIQRAERFDPYPDPNIGPEIPGSRPCGFETPSTERCCPTKLSY